MRQYGGREYGRTGWPVDPQLLSFLILALMDPTRFLRLIVASFLILSGLRMWVRVRVRVRVFSNLQWLMINFLYEIRSPRGDGWAS